MTHPALATVLAPLSAPSGPPLRSTLPPSMPLAPPVSAYTAVRPHDEGSTSDIRNAAILRHRADASAPRSNNASRSRTTVLPSPAPPAGTSFPVLQLHPQPVAGSSACTAPSTSGANLAKVAVCCLPFVVSNRLPDNAVPSRLHSSSILLSAEASIPARPWRSLKKTSPKS